MRWSRGCRCNPGGYIVIQQTEAMTTVDVNTGGYVGQPQPRGDHLPHQPGGDGGHCAPAARAQPRRHHRAGLHRHGGPGASRCADRGAEGGAGAGPHADAYLQHLAAGAGRDEPQAHAREPGAPAVRALPTMPGARLRAHGGDHRRTRSSASWCARAASSTATSWWCWRTRTWWRGCRRTESVVLEQLETETGRPIRLQPEPQYALDQYDVVLA